MATGKREADFESAPGDETVRKISAILADLLEIDPSEIKSDTELEELGADSLLYLELFEELKDEFGLGIELQQIQRYASKHRIATVGEIAQMIERYRQDADAMLREAASGPES